MKLLVASHTYMTAMSQEKVQALSQLVENLVVITPHEFKDTLRTVTIERLPHAQFKLIGVNSIFNRHHSTRIFNPWQLEKIISDLRPDVVCVEQEPYSLNTYQIMRLKKRYGFKVAILSSQNIFKSYLPPFSWVEKYNVKNVDLFICVSSSVKPIWLKKGVPDEKIIILPQVGVSLSQFMPMPNRDDIKKKFGLSRFVFGYAGRFVEEKGIQIFIEAFAELPSRQNCEIVLVGAGPFENELRSLIAQHDMTNEVHILSSVKHHEMPEILNALDALVLPSLQRPHWKEQFGHIIIEAFACGLPVIGTDAMPIPETMGGGGIAVKEADIPAWTAAMDLIYRDKKLYHQLAHHGFQKVKTEYTNEVISKKLIHYLEKL